MHHVDIDLDLLRCFVFVADTRNFTSAGHRLGRSQSAVSVRIKKLEDIVGFPLFDRNSHDVRLTEHGEILLPKATAMLQAGETLLAEIRGPMVTGPLRIGFLEYFAPHKTSEVLTALQRRLPEAELSFRVGLTTQLKDALARKELDVALGMRTPGDEEPEVVATDRLVWVESASHPPVDPSKVLPVCFMQVPCFYRKMALSTLELHGFAFREILTANSVQSIRHAVANGLGCSVLGASSLGPDIRVAENMPSLSELPEVSLALYGNDLRKADIAEVLRDAFTGAAHVL